MSETDPSETPQIVTTAAQPYAAIYRKVPFSEVREALTAMTRQIGETLQAQGIPPTGPWFTHHLERPVTGFDFEAGFPTATSIAPAGDVVPKVWPAMKVARVVHRGDYDGLVAAWGALEAWMKANGHAGGAELWEVYEVSPRENPDASAWRTQLNWPLAG